MAPLISDRRPSSSKPVAALLLLAACLAGAVQAARAADEGKAPAPLKLKVASVDSQEVDAEDGQAANAVDGDAATFWHTGWGSGDVAGPHEIVLELDRAAKVDRVTYLPRQDDNPNGTIREYEVYVSQDGKDFGKPVGTGSFEDGAERKVVKFDAVDCRFVKLRALSEVNGGAWASAAEIGVLQVGEPLPTPFTLEVASVDSEETDADDNQAANAVDGDVATFWHTGWGNGDAAGPHEIVLKLDRDGKVDRVTYLPRQDDVPNGTIRDYEVYVSKDGKDFGKPVAHGAFEDGSERKVVKFDAVDCRFVKLRALSEVSGEAWASAAEIGVLGPGEPLPLVPVMPVPEEDPEGEPQEEGQ